jgi:D-alanyl-D-alanine dipeptidase
MTVKQAGQQLVLVENIVTVVQYELYISNCWKPKELEVVMKTSVGINRSSYFVQYSYT